MLKATKDWVKTVRKREKQQNYLSREAIELCKVALVGRDLREVDQEDQEDPTQNLREVTSFP